MTFVIQRLPSYTNSLYSSSARYFSALGLVHLQVKLYET